MNASRSDDNALNVARIFEFLDGGTGAALPELVTPRYVNPETGVHGARGVLAFRELIRQTFGGDARVHLRAVVADGDQVAVRWTLRGLHLVEFKGIAPTGLPVEVSALSMFGLDAGRVIHSWTETGVPQAVAVAHAVRRRPSRARLHLV
jgi:predicted ester cyclase